MRTILRLGLGCLVLAAVAITVTASTARTSAPLAPYGSVLNDVRKDPLRKRMSCENKYCVQADVTPIVCDVAINENCTCAPPPSSCGNPGGQCITNICE